MRPKTTAAFALIASLLIATATPVSAATADDLASIHTTDSDFQNANTLTNVTVTDSGSAASVDLDLAASYNAVTDTGDGTIDTNTIFIGDESDNTTWDAEVKTSPSRDLLVDELTVDIGTVAGSDYGFTVDVYAIQEDPDSTYGEGTLVKSNWDPDFTSGEQSFNLDTNVDIQAGETWTFEFVTSGSDNDGTRDALFLRLDDSASSTWYTFSGSTRNQYGDLTLSGERDRTGTYISSNHSADRVTKSFVDLTLDNAEATVTWEYWDGSQWVAQDTTAYTTSGNKTATWNQQNTGTWRIEVAFNATSGATTASIDDEGVLFNASAPAFDNATASPSGGTQLTDREVDLSIQVNDSDFATTQDDSVTVTYWTQAPSASSFSKEGTTTITSNGSATLSATFDEGGDWKWYATAEDSYGTSSAHNSTTSTFTVPATLTIRNETPVHGKVDTVSVEIIFYEDEQTTPTIVNRTVTNGEVDLSGLPTGSEFAVSVEASGYHNRTVLVESIYDQDTIYMLQTSTTSHEVTFSVSDNTGNFPAKNTELIVQRAINDSIYDANGDGFNWTNIAGDDLGADEALTADLEADHRYRILVQNEAGDQRVLGAFTPTQDATVNLKIGSVVADPAAPDTVGIGINRTNNSASVEVNFEYNDTTGNTSTIWLEIYEYNNQSNVLLSNTSFTGPYGTFKHVEAVPNSENDTTWVVHYVAIRDTDANVAGEAVVGPKTPVLGGLAGWMVSVVFVGTVWVVAGLFSQQNGDVGGLVVAGLGGIFWFLDFVPPMLGSGVVVLSMITAAILFIRERRAGGL